jgi:hypothetical protein
MASSRRSPRFFFASLVVITSHAVRLSAAPQLVAIFDAAVYQHASGSAELAPKEFAFATGVDFGARVSGVNVTVQPPGNAPIAVPPEDGASFYLERTFASREALDAAFPGGRYTVATSGTQTGSFQLDFGGNRPTPARLMFEDFYREEATTSGRLVFGWTGPGPAGAAYSFAQIQILTEAGDVVATSPDFGDPGALSGGVSYHQFNDIPRADTYVGEITFAFFAVSEQGSTQLLVGRTVSTRFLIRRPPAPDLTPPQILSISPRREERVADGGGPITIVFDKPMDRSNTQKLDLRRYAGFFNNSEIVRGVAEPIWSADARSVNLRFVPPLPTGFYAIDPQRFRDVAGNAPNAAEHPFVVGTPRPWIIVSPSGPLAATGATVTYSVIVKGPEVSYQWLRNGQPVPGARSPVWRPVVDWQSFNPPQIEVEVSNAGGQGRPRAGTFPIMVTPAEYPVLTNLSIRNRAGSGDRALVTGFVVSGAATNLPLLLRGIGPGLVPFGVTGVLTDPQLRVQPAAGGFTALAEDFDGNSQLTLAAASVGAFALTPPSKDAVLVYSAAAGGHTAMIGSSDGQEGIALAEIYRTTGSPSATVGPVLSNVSARAFTGVGADALIAGFTISPSRHRKSLLIRGVGPGLVPFGVAGVLQDPKILIYRSGQNGPVAENDNWESQAESSLPVAQFAEALGAFALPAGSKDAAVLVPLNSGNYTVQVIGADGGTGVALLEIYEL